jgi:hypothetical protein
MNNKQGLLLSELGSYMDNYRGLSESAAAGTKRIGNLIRSIKWDVFHIDRYLLEEADKEVKRLKALGKRILCIWDGSVVEKPESNTAEGLCPVVLSKAKRLNRSRKGHVFNMPAARPVMVTGMHWTGALIAGLEGIPKIALMSWWTTKGDYATKTRKQEEEMIQFFDMKGVEKKLWEIGRGKKYLAHKQIFDVHTGEKMPCDIWWTSVWHASYAYPLYCVKVRVKQKVWYLITNEPVKTEAQAWEIVFIYKRRWQIETSFRYGKCELAMESPRVWALENRLKLLSIVTLVYAFLIHLLETLYRDLVQSVLRLKCHRTGKRCRDILAPLYRLRWAISRLWDDYHPVLGSVFPPNLETLQVLASFRC